jgi:catechol 2,3-dioxygenase-like lactoylglutathione lyase family enzyme
MMRILAGTSILLVAVLCLASCGSSETDKRGSSAAKDKTTSAKAGECPAKSPAVVSARTITTADLDGDGKREAVKLTARHGDCANLLFAKVGEGIVHAQMPVGGLPLSRAFAVEVPGRDGALLVTRQDHPRGGFQLRLYAAGPDGLVELKTDGHPIVPFVALDVQERPLSVDCADGGVVLTEAVAHKPPGGSFAWDIHRTTYAVEDGEVTAGAMEEIADNVLPAQLKAKYPDLVDYSTFKSCRAAG